MAKYLRYWGEFTSRKGTLWRVEIRQEWSGGGDMPEDTAAQEVFFPADSPLVIEWQSTEKYEPVQASCATLKVMSDTDRQFADLYTVVPASVRLDVFRKELQGNVMNWALYWSGTLDTELYEEPYSCRSGYEVSLTFSDFGILSRLDFNLSGMKTIQHLLEASLSAAGLNYRSASAYISTKFSDMTAVTLSSLSVDCANFYDEEGVPMTWREVLKALLQPFALRIIQRQGQLAVYDLVWMYGQPAVKVEWSGTDAVLSRDRVYNNVLVTFSPYGDSTAVKGEVETKEDLNAALDENILVRTNYSDQGDDAVDGFRIYYGNDVQGSGLEITAPAQFFKIEPVFSGDECSGVLWAVRKGDVGMKEAGESGITLIGGEIGCPIYASGNMPRPGTDAADSIFKAAQTVFKCSRIRLQPLYAQLRITLELLYDVRYNPFEDASDGNESGNWKDFKNWCNFGYVPVILNFIAEDGTVIGHYENSGMLESDGYSGRTTLCRWVEGAGRTGDAWLAYYDSGDRKASTGFGGWQTNRQMIGYYRGDLPDIYSRMEQGEYIVSPAYRFNRSGYLELTVLSGVYQFDYQREVKNIYPKIRWVAYRNPSVVLVDKNGFELEGKDYEDSAHINMSAREDLAIATTVGTRSNLPVSRGILYKDGDAYNGLFRRGNASNTLERLLIGSVYSQYAEGKVVLSGSAALLPGMRPLSDSGTAGKFIMRSEVQDIREEESTVEIVELSEENYTGVEYA